MWKYCPQWINDHFHTTNYIPIEDRVILLFCSDIQFLISHTHHQEKTTSMFFRPSRTLHAKTAHFPWLFSVYASHRRLHSQILSWNFFNFSSSGFSTIFYIHSCFNKNRESSKLTSICIVSQEIMKFLRSNMRLIEVEDHISWSLNKGALHSPYHVIVNSLTLNIAENQLIC